MDKPFIPAAEKNKQPIGAALVDLLQGYRHVLEIGAGTGQHAVHFAALMPDIVWQTSEVAAALPGVKCWTDEAGRANLPPPLLLDVRDPWPAGSFDAVYTANTTHFMAPDTLELMVQRSAGILAPGGRVVIYGPFNDDGRYTSSGNRALDAWLKSVDPAFGLRDEQAVIAISATAGLAHVESRAMPANNRLLVFDREPAPR